MTSEMASRAAWTWIVYCPVESQSRYPMTRTRWTQWLTSVPTSSSVRSCSSGISCECRPHRWWWWYPEAFARSRRSPSRRGGSWLRRERAMVAPGSSYRRPNYPDVRTSCASLPPQPPPCLHPPHDIIVIQSLLPEEHVRAIYSVLLRIEETKMMRFSRPYPSSVHGFEVFLLDRTQNAGDYVQHPWPFIWFLIQFRNINLKNLI